MYEIFRNETSNFLSTRLNLKKNEGNVVGESRNSDVVGSTERFCLHRAKEQNASTIWFQIRK